MSICSQALDFQGQLKSLAEILCLQIEKSRFQISVWPGGKGSLWFDFLIQDCGQCLSSPRSRKDLTKLPKYEANL